MFVKHSNSVKMLTQRCFTYTIKHKSPALKFYFTKNFKHDLENVLKVYEVNYLCTRKKILIWFCIKKIFVCTVTGRKKF